MSISGTHCPLCGGSTRDERLSWGFIVCNGCAEILAPSELVRRATRRTRRRYVRAQKTFA